MGKKVINMILLLVIVKDSINKIEINNMIILKDMINKDRYNDKGIMIEIIAKKGNKKAVNIIKNKKKEREEILHNNQILLDLDREIKKRNMTRRNKKNKNILSIEDMIHQNNLIIGKNIKNDIPILYLIFYIFNNII